MATQELVMQQSLPGIPVPESRELTIQSKDILALGRAPDVVLEEAHKAAAALTKVIEAKPKKVVLNGKTYLQFEDWQTLGRFYGVTAIVLDTKYVEFGEDDERTRGFESRAQALLVGTNQVISAAEAMCLDDEQNWGYRETRNGKVKVPLFQLKSMAQTRACAKALRNVLAWVVVLAGYQATPAEEMPGNEDTAQPTFQPPQRKSQVPASTVIESEGAKHSRSQVATPTNDIPAFDEIGKDKCAHARIQPAGVSKKNGKPYSAFCKDCGAHV